MSTAVVNEPVTLQRLDLNDQVYGTLREWLVNGRLGPGDRLSLHSLASTLGVSRSPVHHALTRLVSDGLVSVQPRRGYFVTPLTPKVMHDAYDVRLALELIVAERTVGRISDDDVARLRELMLPTLPPRGVDAAEMDPKAWHHANQAFHECHIGLARNPVLAATFRSLNVNILMERVLAGQGGPWLRDVTEEHSAIVDAYERGDLTATQEALRRHNETSRRIAAEAIARAGGAA
ncbi:MAG TPA: GntR family transcriptional regulator [Gaiellaceae bacterium]|nr:GntR family transcriptional regulator [Gaiellaceae bacterium]